MTSFLNGMGGAERTVQNLADDLIWSAASLYLLDKSIWPLIDREIGTSELGKLAAQAGVVTINNEIIRYAREKQLLPVLFGTRQ